MTGRQIQIVRRSFEALTPQRNRLAGLFFAQLFVREPSLRPLFRSDLRQAGAELFDGLAAIVDSLDRLYPIVPALEWLAVRSARRGIGVRHHAAIAEAMLAAARDGLGESYTPELEAAWRGAIARVAAIMEGALQAEPIAA